VKTLNNLRSLVVVFFLAMLVFTLIPRVYSSTLALTVSMTKQFYLVTDDISAYGSLTFDDSPIPNWPVAMEVQDPIGTPVVTRTAQTNVSGAYILTFKLPTSARLGTYTVYVSSSYKGEMATNDTTFELIPVRDVAVTGLAPSKTVVGQGYSIRINVTAENQGEITETFNATVYANTTIIETKTVTLTSGNSATITFSWNTTYFAKGNYTMSAYAWPVQDEVDITDNELIAGVVFVGIPGDLDANGVVDIFDLVRIALRFGETLPQPVPWPYPPEDINSDGLLDIFDIVVVALHFGEIG